MPPALKPMAKGNGKPIEKDPRRVGLVPVPRNWGATQGGIPYKPGNKPYQESWETVARDFGVDVDDLIHFNFLTLNSDVVNWYLREHVGCFQPSPSGNNWMFSKGMRPGIVYIPPPEPRDQTIDFEPLEMCSWDDYARRQAFVRRLRMIAQGVRGPDAKRVQRLVQVIGRQTFAGAKRLWYYNDFVIEMYVDPNTGDAQRRESTKHSIPKGSFPFRGYGGWHLQRGLSEAGGEERRSGQWQIHAVQKMFDDLCSGADDAAIRQRLLAIDKEMYKGWYAMTLVSVRGTAGGGSTVSKLVDDFIMHVTRHLVTDKNHLYWAFGK